MTCIVVAAEVAGANEWLVRLIAKVPLAATLVEFFLIAYLTSTIAGTVQWEWYLQETLESGIVRIIGCTPSLMLGFFTTRSDEPRALPSYRAVLWIGPIAFAQYAGRLAVDRDYYIGERSQIDRTASRAMIAVVRVGMTMAVLGWSVRLLAQHPLSVRLSAAAFAIYLFHIPVMDVLWAITRGWNPWLRFLLFVPAATAICHAAHQLLIQSAVLAFLFNGRPLPARSGKPRTAR